MGKKKLSLTHLNDKGEAHIVDVGSKYPTARQAIARARVEAKPETVDAIFDSSLEKGDAIAVARVAGIMAAKKTADLIPLCHTLSLTSVEVEITRSESPGIIDVVTIARTTDRTGVEMEALVAASVTALTLYDMAKSIDRGMSISRLELMEKSGGKSGTFKRGE